MVSVVPPICSGCKNLIGDLKNPICRAFATIPLAILLSQKDHRQPYEGDNGIRFVPKTPDDAEYAALVFDDEAK